MEFNDVRRLLQQMADEERNWRGARAKVGELLNAADAAQSVIDSLSKSGAELRQSNNDLAVELANARSVGLKNVQREVDELESKLSLEIKELQDQIAKDRNSAKTAKAERENAEKNQRDAEAKTKEVLDKLDVAEKQLVKVTTSFESFKKEHSL